MIPFVLSLPWGLFAQTPLDGRPVRHALRPGDAVELDGRHGTALAVAAGTGLKLSGRRWSTQPLGMHSRGTALRCSCMPCRARR